jgi:hypothetical protein
LDFDHLKEAPVVAHQLVALQTGQAPRAVCERAQYQLTEIWLAMVRSAIHCLWMVKDNAATVQFGFWEHPYGAKTATIVRFAWHGNFFDARGSSDEATLTPAEVADAQRLYSLLEDSLLNLARGVPNVGRWSTAWAFLDTARIQSRKALGLRVAHYCTAFEALFSSGNKDALMHTLAERIACFLETDQEERIRLFRRLKKAYGLRSSVVHGTFDAASGGRQGEELSILCDTTLRRLLRQTLEGMRQQPHFFGKPHKKAFRQYLADLVRNSGIPRQTQTSA